MDHSAAVGFMTVKGLFTLTTIPSETRFWWHVSRMRFSVGQVNTLIPGYTQAMITAESGEIQPLTTDQGALCSSQTKRFVLFICRQTPEHYHRSRAVK